MHNNAFRPLVEAAHTLYAYANCKEQKAAVIVTSRFAQESDAAYTMLSQGILQAGMIHLQVESLFNHNELTS